jgi:NAD-dependent dihydropyrimidine dehydrogenase PreA subunit/bacterioferritin-associated ferredoxin
MTTNESQRPEKTGSFLTASLERCVHAISPFASCSECVDACPRFAWAINKTGLDLDIESCDQCGLCVPACPEGAIEYDKVVEPLVSIGPEPRSAFAICDRATEEREPGRMSCIHAIGVRSLAQLYSRGVRRLVAAHADCSSCSRKAKTSLEDHLEDLRRLLDDRELDGFEVQELEPTAWREARDEASKMSRRGLFRSAWRRVGDTATEVERASRTKPITAGEWLPGARDAQLSLFVPHIDPGICSACGACLELCPHNVIKLTDTEDSEHNYEIDATSCTGCRLCVDVCDVDAIELKRWSHPHAPPIHLILSQCGACGNAYYQTTKLASDTNLCRICASSHHHQNLFQVLP